MARPIEQIIFPELFGDHPMFVDDGDDQRDVVMRRPYRIFHRAEMGNWDDIDFFRRFRLTKPTFLHVLEMVEPALRHPQPRPRYVTPQQQLLITLRFLASGNMQITTGDVVRVSQPTVCKILPKVCMAIIAHLRDTVKMPATPEERQQSAAAFYRIAEFPFTIGAIDCTHVKINSPGGDMGEVFRNRKGYFSLNVQTISSASLRVLDIVARWPGSVHDQTIFMHSNIRDRFVAREFGEFILIGDSGYANTHFLATPFTANNNELPADPAMQMYQRSLISTRNVVERQYGVLKRRFPVLAYGIRMRVEGAQKLIVASAILHSIAMDANEIVPPLDENELLRFRDMMIADEAARHVNELENQGNIRRGALPLARDIVLRRFRNN